jgi:hypothetical protein
MRKSQFNDNLLGLDKKLKNKDGSMPLPWTDYTVELEAKIVQCLEKLH